MPANQRPLLLSLLVLFTAAQNSDLPDSTNRQGTRHREPSADVFKRERISANGVQSQYIQQVQYPSPYGPLQPVQPVNPYTGAQTPYQPQPQPYQPQPQPYGPAPIVQPVVPVQQVGTVAYGQQSPLGGYCPVNQVPQINHANGVAQGCPDGGNCGAGFTCQISTTRQHLCCGPVGQCPSGGSVATNVEGRVQTCSQNPPSGCSPPATCQQATGGYAVGAQFICCNGVGNQGGMCANGGTPYISGVNGAPLNCNPGGYIGCPIGYSCQASSAGTSICCSDSGAAQNVCPANYQPSVINNQVQYCYVTLPQSCTPPYQCLQAANGVGFVCCRPGGVLPSPCPNGQTPLLVNGQTEYCTSVGVSCSSPGYTCQQSYDGTQRVCCGGRSGTATGWTCPGGRQPLFLNATPFTCSVAANNCPTGYGCEQANNGQYVCCAGGGGGGGTTSQHQFGLCQDGTPASSACNTLGNDPLCGTTQTCQPVTGADNFDGCCGGGGVVQPVGTSECQNGRLPDMANGQVRQCNPQTPSCRQGYECIPAASGGGSICCRGPRCPGGVTIGSGPNGLPIRCTQGGGQCPSNQRCENSVGGLSELICCPV